MNLKKVQIECVWLYCNLYLSVVMYVQNQNLSLVMKNRKGNVNVLMILPLAAIHLPRSRNQARQARRKTPKVSISTGTYILGDQINLSLNFLIEAYGV